MKKITVKVPAKINLTLDVSSGVNGFHDINSLVSTVDLYDVITLEKRADKEVSLVEKGIVVGGDLNKNNAVRSAKLFMDEEGVNGVDIILEKSIPIGGGLGGSSADIAGVLFAMNLLFERNADIESLANRLGSDSGYMTRGGYAVLSGRGDKIQSLPIDKTLYYILITDDAEILAKDAYKWFDEVDGKPKPCTSQAVRFLQDGDVDGLVEAIKNDLFLGVKGRHPRLEKKIADLLKVGAKASLMTGSGSVVYGVFDEQDKMLSALKTIEKSYRVGVIPCKTAKGIEVISEI